jgi:hypothetical protein
MVGDKILNESRGPHYTTANAIIWQGAPPKPYGRPLLLMLDPFLGGQLPGSIRIVVILTSFTSSI